MTGTVSLLSRSGVTNRNESKDLTGTVSLSSRSRTNRRWARTSP